MGGVATLGLVCATSTAINTFYTIQKGDSGVTPLLAGAVIYVSLSTFGGLTGRQDIANAFAYLFLLSAILQHGTKLIDGVTSVVTRKK